MTSSTKGAKRNIFYSPIMDDGIGNRMKEENYGWSVEMLLRFTCWPPRFRCTCFRRWVYSTYMALRTKMSLRQFPSRPHRPCHLFMTFVFAFILLVLVVVFIDEYLPSIWMSEKRFTEFSYPTSRNHSLHDILYQYELHGSSGLDKYVQPINNYHTFHYRLLPKFSETLHENHTSSILMAVKTTHAKMQQRQVIRQLWGRAACYERHGIHLQLVFLLGASRDALAERRLQAEHRKYGDIVQQDFLDAYYNNTYKFMMALDYTVSRWRVHNTHTTDTTQTVSNINEYVIFVDDDYFVNPMALIDYVKRSISPHEMDTFVGGTMLFHARPFRSHFSKWHMSIEEYPFEYYPDYLAGGFILMSATLAKNLRVCLPFVKYFPFDDVFLGFMLYELRILPRHMSHVYDTKHYSQFTQLDIASHGFSNPNDLIHTWNQLHVSKFCYSQDQHQL